METIATKIPTLTDVKGLSKQEVIDLLGHGYNDINSPIWMYFLKRKRFFSNTNYLYLVFNNDKVAHARYRRFPFDHTRQLDQYFKRFLNA